MLFQITARPDARLIAAALRRCLRRPLLIARGAGLALLLAAVTVGGHNPVLLTVGVLLAVGYPILVVNAGTRRLVDGGRLTTYEISDGGVASSSLDARHSYAWHTFRYVEQTAGQLVFGLGRAAFLPVPTAGLSPSQIDQVLGAAAGHGLPVRRA